jgi:hypothetical protein
MTNESEALRIHVVDNHITAKAGVPFSVELPGPGSTGYELKPRDLSSTLELVDENSEPGEGIGTMGKTTFTFVSQTEGVFDLWIDSKRPWE